VSIPPFQSEGLAEISRWRKPPGLHQFSMSPGRGGGNAFTSSFRRPSRAHLLFVHRPVVFTTG